MFAFTTTNIMHTKASAPANSEATGISVIKIIMPFEPADLPLQDNKLPALHPHNSLQQNSFLLAQNDPSTRRASYAERRLSRYL